MKVSEVVMHRNTRAFIMVTAFTSAIWLAAPAWAQRGHEARGQAQGRQTRQTTSQPAPVRPEGRATAPVQPRAQVQQAPPVDRAVPRGQVQGSGVSPAERRTGVTRSAPAPQAASVLPRGTQSQRYAAPVTTYRPAPYYSAPYRNSYGYGYGYGHPVPRPVFVQPYYVYHPRFTFSFGIGVGYGVAYPWTYWNPYGFYNYGITIHPGYSPAQYYNYVGGVSFDLQPSDAAVYVDGQYVGVACDFGPEQMPLTLAAGRHRIELKGEGYQTAKFDITIAAGQVIPYRGALQYD